MSIGESRKNTMRYLACAFTAEITEVLKIGRVYSEESYLKKLHALPKLNNE